MSEVSISANKKLKTINTEFQENFPYLMLAFFTKQEWQKTKKNDEEIYALDMNTYIRDIRTTTPEDGQEFSIHGNTRVDNFEKNILDMFGLYMQVCYIDKDGGRYYTSGETDKMTLSTLNKLLEKHNCQEYPEMQTGPDNSSVKTDQITFSCQALHEALCSKLPGLTPVSATKHYAKGRNIEALREYYVDVDDEDIESFFIEWDPDEEEMYIGFLVVPPKTDRTGFKVKLETLCDKQDDIETNEYACFITYEVLEYDEFPSFDMNYIKDQVQLFKTLKKIRRQII